VKRVVGARGSVKTEKREGQNIELRTLNIERKKDAPLPCPLPIGWGEGERSDSLTSALSERMGEGDCGLNREKRR